MMKKLFLTFVTLGLLVACATDSSAPKNIDGDNNDAALASDAEIAGEQRANDEVKAQKKELAPSKTTVSAAAASNSTLALAFQSGNDETLKRSAIQILQQNPNDVRALNALGLYHYRRGHFPAAQLMFNKALKVDNNSSELHNNLGLVLLSQKDLSAALKEFRTALQLNPENGDAAVNIGAIYVENQDYNKALVAMEIAYKKNARDVRVLNNYGIALAATGKYDQANDVYKEALRISSSDKNVLLNQAILYVDHLKKYQDGLDIVNKIKFLGLTSEARSTIIGLENRAKAGLK
jgi:Tfp pilus assembly protein PilF